MAWEGTGVSACSRAHGEIRGCLVGIYSFPCPGEGLGTTLRPSSLVLAPLLSESCATHHCYRSPLNALLRNY